MSNKNLDSMTESQVERRLEELKHVPARDPLKAASGRARFLSEAGQYRHAQFNATGARQSGRIFPIRKNSFAVNALAVLILVLTLFIGGGATVAAAQNDLPNQPLYQVKLWTEDASLAMEGDPQEQADLLITLAQARIQEMTALAEMGITPPDQVRERLEQHLHQALELAAGMEDASREQLLLQLHERLQTQDHVMEQLQSHTTPESKPQFLKTRQMLQTQLQLVDKGLADPKGFRDMIQNQKQHGPDKEETPGLDQQGGQGSPQNGPGAGNGNGNGNDSPGQPNSNGQQNGNGEDGGHGNQDKDKPHDGNCSGANCNNGGNDGGGHK